MNVLCSMIQETPPQCSMTGFDMGIKWPRSLKEMWVVPIKRAGIQLLQVMFYICIYTRAYLYHRLCEKVEKGT